MKLTKVYLLKRYSPSDNFWTFFSESAEASKRVKVKETIYAPTQSKSSDGTRDLAIAYIILRVLLLSMTINDRVFYVGSTDIMKQHFIYFLALCRFVSWKWSLTLASSISLLLLMSFTLFQKKNKRNFLKSVNNSVSAGI